MKQSLLAVLLFMFLEGTAQVPQQVNYQGIARNSVGSVIANQTISLRLSIREGSATGTVVYRETRTLKTNNFGLFFTAIGSVGASNVFGTFTSINWSSGVKFLQVEIDPAGATAFLDMGTSQLQSVPYAFYASAAPPVGTASGDLQGNFPSPQIKDGAITSSKIADGSVTPSKLATGVIPNSLPPSGNAGGDLTGTYPAPTIANGSVNNSKIADNAIGTSKIQDASVTAAKLAAGVIPTSLPPGGTASGDLSGTYPNPTINAGAVDNGKIADNAITTNKVADASITAAKLAPGVIPTSLPPSGTAAGDLTGTYPNPTINVGAVNTSKIADGSVTTSKLAPGVIPTSLPPSGTAAGDLTGTYPNPTISTGAVDNGKLADNAVTTNKVADASITAAKLAPGVIPTIPTTLPPSGTASGDLTGTYPNPMINTGAVNTGKLADDAVVTAKIKDASVTTAKIADGNITAAKLAPGVIPTSLPPSGTAAGDLTGTYPNPTINTGAVDNTKIADNAISTNKLQDGSVTAAKLDPSILIGGGSTPTGPANGDLTGTYPNPTIKAGAVDNSKVADNAITTNKVADNAITTNKVADGSITAAKLAAGVIPTIPTTLPPSGSAGGDLTGSYPNPTINAGAVDNTKLADGAVTTNKVVDGSITAAKLDPSIILGGSGAPTGPAGGELTGTYPNPAIANNAITTGKIADGSITTAKLAAGVIPTIPTTLPPSGTAAGDLTGTYPNPSVAANAITTSKIADNSITTSKVVDGSITAAKLDPSILLGGGSTPTGAAGGDLSGTYPNPGIANNAITTAKIADGNVTAAKLAPGVIPTIPTTLPPSGTAGGDLNGTYPNPTIANDAITTAKIADGNITAAKLAAGVIPTIPTTLPPSGTAGGDLSGTYPNPTINANAITTTKIADGNITAAKLAPGVIPTIPTTLPPSGTASGDLGGTFPAPSVDKIKGVVVSATAPTTGQVLKYDGTQWAPGVDNGGSGGSPTGSAGGDLSGNYPNPSLASGAVTNSKIANGAVITPKIADGAVNNNKLADNSVTSIKIVDGTITAADLDPSLLLGGGGSPTGAAGGDLAGTYPNPTVAANAITSTKLADNSVTTTKIADGNVTAAKLAAGVIPTIPTTLPPSGSAGGDLTGSYPNPTIANDAITTAKIADGNVTAAKLAAGVIPTIPTTLPPSGTAGGDLSGTYPNPTVANNAITTSKVADNTITSAKIVDGTITAADLDPSLLLGGGGPPTGSAGGDLAGTYPNPTVAANAITSTKLADNAVTTNKIADGNVTAAKLAAGVIPTIPTTLPPSGSAGGDLAGTYPNPTIANDAIITAKIADGNVTAAKLAPGVIPTIPTTLPPSGSAGGDLTGTYPNPTVAANTITSAKIVDGTITAADLDPSLLLGGGGPPTGAAGGDLSGTYPNPTVAANAITSTKLADNAVTTNKIADGNVTAAKLAAGVIPTTLPPSGSAGGDLTGSYPNPTIASNAITTAKIADGNVTAAKLAPGVIPTIPTTLPPSGTASGDLGGTYPSPSVDRIKGVGVSTTAPTTGQVLKFDGTQWAPATDATGGGGLTLPYSQTINSAATTGFAITNTGAATSLQGDNSSTSTTAIGVLGRITQTSPGADAAGVKGLNSGLGVNGYGVWGHHAGGGVGVNGTSISGEGVFGSSTTGTGVFGTSNDGAAAYFDISNANNFSDAMFVSTNGYGNGIVSIGTYNNGMLGIANDVGGAGVFGAHNAGGEGVLGRTFSNTAAGVVGRNDGTYAGVRGFNTTDNGVGVLAQANTNGAINGTALVAELEGTGAGNTAVFKANGSNVARIDKNGKGFFNGGTQVGGADLAEYFDVEGQVNSYEPGDVLMISTTGDRKVEKSKGAYSTLVAGVYATKPGLMLTEHNAEQDQLDQMVPMGVIGVIPTKVCTEGGAIKRGDLIVTSSITGVAMKADPDKVKVGQVIGKALEDYDANGIGKIKILVSIK